MVEVKIGPMESGKKMHRFLRQLLPGVPLSGIHKMLRTGRVKRNGKKAKSEEIVLEGDLVTLYMAEEDYAKVSKSERKFQGVDADIEVVYEDDAILVVNKPAGTLMHGTQDEHKETLANQVLAYLHKKGMDIRAFAPSPVHRLDRNTSGLVIFAKDGPTARELSSTLAEHQIHKWYLAIVRGQLEPSGVIDAAVERDDQRNRTEVAQTGGKTAVTKYHRLVHTTNSTVALVELISGRTHQIRAHFAHIGHPLIGDTKYGGGRSRSGDAHQWLHAGWLQMPDGRVFHASIPAAFRNQLRRLGYSDADLTALGGVRPQNYRT